MSDKTAVQHCYSSNRDTRKKTSSPQHACTIIFTHIHIHIHITLGISTAIVLTENYQQPVTVRALVSINQITTWMSHSFWCISVTSTSDSDHVLHRYDTGLRAKFCRRTSQTHTYDNSQLLSTRHQKMHRTTLTTMMTIIMRYCNKDYDVAVISPG